MKYFKPKDILKHEGDEVKIQIVGKQPDIKKEFKGITTVYTPLDILIGGESYVWEVDQDKKDKIKSAGCGTTFYIRAYKAKSGFIGFNYCPDGDVSLNYGERKTIDPKDNMDEVQERIIRGMAWNAAVAIVAERNDIKPIDILTLAKDLHEIGAEWLRTGKPAVNPTVKTAPQTHGASTSGDFLLNKTVPPVESDLDLPF